ncbi:MAG: T9SS type A sorting domain-containing protein [Bacteroidota bacterium]
MDTLSRISTLGLLILLLGFGQVFAQVPANDDLCNAQTLVLNTSCGGSTNGDNTGATAQANEPTPSCLTGGGSVNSVWFSFVGDSAGAVNITMPFAAGSLFFSAMAVYQLPGSAPCTDLSNLIELDCVAAGGFPGTLTITGLPVIEDSTYYVQVFGVGPFGNEGTFCIEVSTPQPPPINDNICDAVALFVGDSCSAAAPNGTSVGATNEPNEAAPSCGFGAAPSVWYKHTSLSSNNTIITLSELGIGGGTIAVFEPAPGDSCNNIQTLTEIACQGFFGLGTLIFPSDSNATYYIQVSSDAVFGGSGPFCITLTEVAPLSNDQPCEASVVPVDGTPYAFANVGATVDPGENNLIPPNTWIENNVDASVWLKFAVPSTGGFNVDLCQTGTGFDTQIALFSVGDCNNYNTFNFVGGDDDGDGFCTLGNQFSSTFEACYPAGDTLYILVDGFQGEVGLFELSITPITPQPITASLNASPPDCPGTNTARVNLNPSGGLGSVSVLWSTGDTTQNLENVGPGTYSVTITDNCSSFSDTIVVGDAAPLIVNAGMDQTFCPGDTIFLGGTPSAVGGKIFGGASKGFGHLQGGNGADVFSNSLSNPNQANTIASLLGNLNGADFTPNGLLVINNGSEDLIRIDTLSGNSTTIGPMAALNGYDWSGLAYNPQNDTLYGVSTNGLNGRLHYVDPNSGSFTNGPFMTVSQPLWLAIASDGSAYTLDAVTDSIFSVDLSSGETLGLAAAGSNYTPNVGLDADVWDADGKVYFFTEVDPAGFQAADLLQFDPSNNAVSTVGTLGVQGSPRAWAIASENTDAYLYEWKSANSLNDPTIANPYSLTTEPNSFVLKVEDACGTIVSDTIALNTAFEIDILDGTGGGTTGSGQATVNIIGGTAPIQILWSTGDTTATLTAPSSGVYGVSVTDASACTQTDSVEIWTTAIDAFGKAGINELSLYPNPANTDFVVKLSLDRPQAYRLALLNTRGQIVWQQAYSASQTAQNEIEVSSLASGLYVMQLQTEEGSFSKRILIKH